MKPLGFSTSLRRISGSSLAIWSLLGLLTTAQAVPYNPPNRGAPGRTSTIRDAGSRGCGIIALEPSQTHWGETLQPQPTFWVFLSEAGRTLRLTLTDEATAEILYEATYPDIPQPGISRLAPPADAPPLKPDQPYRWQISVDCPDEGDEDPFTSGIVVRRTPSADLNQQLATATPRDRITLLGSHGLWYDTVTELANLRHRHPDDEDLTAAWATLLENPFVNLGDLVDQPLPQHCPPAEE